MKKRFIGILLSFALMLTMMPVGYHRRGSLTPQRIKIVLEKGYTS